MKLRHLVLWLGVGLTLSGSSIHTGGQTGAEVPYPQGYRQWTHVKSMIINPGHPLYEAVGGIHHVYANAAALKTLQSQSRTSFPDGAVLVFDLLESIEASNAVTEGDRKVVFVMHKDANKFARTGGWGFEGFKGNTRDRVVTDPVSGCYECHTQQKENDYVFSEFRR